MTKLWRMGGTIIMIVVLTLPCAVGAGKQDKDQSSEKSASKDSKADKKSAKTKKQEASVEEAEHLPAALMRRDEDLSILDTYYGAGGKENSPDPNGKFTFIEEDLGQTQPKIDVKDGQGRHWRIKLGDEVKPETAATHLVWAAGYFVDANYYLDHVEIQELHDLKRGKRYMKGNVANGARLKLQPEKQKNLGYWAWTDNPFTGSRELNGLRVMMALMNNWDLVNRNNKIYSTDGERRYLVSDLGATFGRTGNELTRKDGDLKAYAESKFIEKVTPDTVDFVNHSRPLPPMALGLGRFKGMPHYYSDLVRGGKVVKNIPRADAKWIGQRLARLSESQIRDCFRAAGYSPEESEGFADVVRKRIAELAAL